jgi:hypothetical protein
MWRRKEDEMTGEEHSEDEGVRLRENRWGRKEFKMMQGLHKAGGREGEYKNNLGLKGLWRMFMSPPMMG